jgi:hypothetical protein
VRVLVDDDRLWLLAVSPESLELEAARCNRLVGTVIAIRD